MRVLILTCGTGGGHNTAAAALEEEMLRRGHQVQVMNAYDLKSRRLAALINQSYIRLVQHCPALFGMIYKIGDLWHKTRVKSPVYHLHRKLVPYLRNHLNSYRPDVVLMTHFFPGEIITAMKAAGDAVPPSIYVSTDYTCIPLADEIDCDACIIPSEKLALEFFDRGIPPERVYPMGIPVHRQICEAECRQTVRRRLGMHPSDRYILIAGGSMGSGCFVKAARLLEKYLIGAKEARLIVVCGSNEKMKRRIERQIDESSRDRITVLGFTHQMADYLKACDVFITKPGGLSTTEAAVAGIPLILMSPIPGCETKNQEFFEKHSMALTVHSPKKELTAAVERLLDPGLVSMMRRRQRQINPRAAADICDLAETMNQGG